MKIDRSIEAAVEDAFRSVVGFDPETGKRGKVSRHGGTPHKHVNFRIRGVFYRDANHAAQELGVKPQAVRQAARRGTLDLVGLGRRGMEPMSISIRGEIFENAKAAADHFGVGVTAIYQAMHKGDPDAVGRKRGPSWKAKPFRIGGMEWPSMRQASIEMGLGPTYVSLAVRRGSKRMLERIVARAMEIESQQIREQRKDMK